MTRLRVYLAGPDVFLPAADAAAVSLAKRQLCAAHGFVGVSPVDNEIDTSGMPKHQAALCISAANEKMMRGCDLAIANLTPFRGPSADVGTVYELGFMRALGKPVFGYSTQDGTLLERTRQALGGEAAQGPSGEWEDSFRMVVENFDCVDNLMLVGAVEAGGAHIVVVPAPAERRFTDLAGFELCLKLAAQKLVAPQPQAAARA
jgi:nucleoside 2-deoxyribosyltransferase